MADLVYRQPCEHEGIHRMPMDWIAKWESWVPCGAAMFPGELGCRSGEHCPGGSEIVLDPDKVLDRRDGTPRIVTVSDVLAALEETP